MSDMLYNTVKGVSLAFVHSSLIGVGFAFMDNWLDDKIISGTHLASIHVLQAIGGLAAVGGLMSLSGGALSDPSAGFAYELGLTFTLNPIMGVKFETVQSFIINEALSFLIPDGDTTWEQRLAAAENHDAVKVLDGEAEVSLTSD